MAFEDQACGAVAHLGHHNFTFNFCPFFFPFMFQIVLVKVKGKNLKMSSNNSMNEKRCY